MLSLEKMREIDPRLADKSDTELEELRASYYDMTQLFFDIWWARKSGSKNPTGLLAPAPVGDTITICKKKRNPKKPE